MPTIDKAEKPTILTESDQVLNDLKSELAQLKSRMSSIEQEQEKNRILVEKLSFQEELANEAILNHQKESKANRENYHVIAGVMSNLKSPVHSVVTNLSGVIAEIDDGKTKKTLEECMQTASNVLNSFDDVEDFCLNAGKEVDACKVAVNVRKFFRDALVQFQSSPSYNNMDFRLLVDKQVPETTALQCDAIMDCLCNLVKEVHHLKNNASSTIYIGSEKQDEKYGLEITDLSITINWEGSSEIKWDNSWLSSIQCNHENLVNSGFNLLKTRDLVRRTGGYLEVMNENNKIGGFKLLFPMTY